MEMWDLDPPCHGETLFITLVAKGPMLGLPIGSLVCFRPCLMHGLDVQSLAVFDSTRNRRDMKSQEKGSTIKCKGHILWANSTSRMEPQHYRCRPLIWGILPVCQGHSFHTFLSGTRFCDE
jgi:hypothetical protein